LALAQKANEAYGKGDKETALDLYQQAINIFEKDSQPRNDIFTAVLKDWRQKVKKLE